MVAGSGMISTSIALNAVSTHGTCSAVFTAVAAICTFILASIRTLNKMSWLAWIGTASVLVASESSFEIPPLYNEGHMLMGSQL
jgi:hypothetical protein